MKIIQNNGKVLFRDNLKKDNTNKKDTRKIINRMEEFGRN